MTWIRETVTTDVFASFEGDIPASGRRSSPARLARLHRPAVFAFLGGLLVWEGLTRLFGVESFVLSKPSEILTSFSETFGVIWRSGDEDPVRGGGRVRPRHQPGRRHLTGCGPLGRVPARCAPSRHRAQRNPDRGALAPIFNNWFGLTNPFSKMAVVAVVVYFPVMINTTRGLLEVDPAELELMRSLAASPSEVTRRIRIPGPCPISSPRSRWRACCR